MCYPAPSLEEVWHAKQSRAGMGGNLSDCIVEQEFNWTARLKDSMASMLYAHRSVQPELW